MEGEDGKTATRERMVRCRIRSLPLRRVKQHEDVEAHTPLSKVSRRIQTTNTVVNALRRNPRGSDGHGCDGSRDSRPDGPRGESERLVCVMNCLDVTFDVRNTIPIRTGAPSRSGYDSLPRDSAKPAIFVSKGSHHMGGTRDPCHGMFKGNAENVHGISNLHFLS